MPAYQPRKFAIYDNYAMLSPENTFMAYCTKRRADWYVRKNLAEFIEDKKFRLKFSPNGPGGVSEFSLNPLENKCVVCGSTEGLTSHHVVPRMFRTWLPAESKSKNCHDVLAVCISCHEKYESFAAKYKEEIFNNYDEVNYYINGIADPNREYKKIKAARRIIGKIGNLLPPDRVRYLQEIASKDLPQKIFRRKHHIAKTVMNKVMKNNEINEFVFGWRRHFVENMQPQFLPKGWAIER